jgi:hypothetical protein
MKNDGFSNHILNARGTVGKQNNILPIDPSGTFDPI